MSDDAQKVVPAVFLIVESDEKGPKILRMLADNEEVDLDGGEEFMTAYIKPNMKRRA